MPTTRKCGLCSARLAGVIYLAIVGLGLFGEIFVRGSLVAGGDIATTARNIIASQSLWRTGIATDLLMHVLDVPLIVFFYLLLRPVSPPLALLATVLNVVQTCVLVSNKLSLVAALSLVTPSTSLSAVAPQVLHALAYLAIKLHGYGFGIGLIFFGFSCLVRGYLMVRSTFVPRFLGVLLSAAGVSYIVNSLALLLAPALAAVLFPAILLPALVGELALCVWLIVKGKDADPGSPWHPSNSQPRDA